MSWFYAEGTVQKGPVSDEEFQRLVAAGTVRADTLVWREGMANWLPGVQAAPQVFAAAGAQTAGPATGATPAGDVRRCAECGGTFARKDMVAYAGSFVCAGCRDAFFQKVREGVATVPLTSLDYAGFWVRFGAYIIDYIVLVVVQMIVQFPIMALFGFGAAMEFDPESGAFPAMFFIMYAVMMVLQMTIVFGYKVFFLGKFGATPGKMALSLKVVRADGGKLSYGRAFGRAAAEIISALIACIGYIIAAFDDEKRALHDRICDTRVVRTGS